MPMPVATLKKREWGWYLGGEFHAAGEPHEVRSPYDGALIATTFLTPEEKIEEAVATAAAARETIAALPTWRRAELLRALAAGVEARREDLSRLLALEAGKPIRAARQEVDRSAFTFRNAAEEAQRIHHEMIPLDLHPAGKGRWGLVRRFPVGAVLAVTPFNFPVNLIAHKLGPALAAGCPLVLKPSPKTPLTALLMAEIARDAGVPPEALSVINCTNERAAQLAEDPRFRLLTFTGSAEVGWMLRSRAGKKRVALELGGNAGAVIAADADVHYAAERCAIGGFGFSGQSCISVQRIFAHRNVYENFTAAVVERARALRTGDPMDEKTDAGPLITRQAAERVESWVKDAAHSGAKVLCGGGREGSIVAPAVLTETRPDMNVNCREVFGPVVTVEPFDDFDRVLAAVNSTPYGLHAGVFTRDIKAAFRAFERLEVGGVIVNDVPTFRVDHMPYGGAKDSGAGREGPRYAIEEMTEPRLLVLNLDA